jgi:heterotetrameric sarcosine oxidase gamma subunit
VDSLQQNSPLDSVVSFEVEGLSVTPIAAQPLAFVMPFRGQEAAVSKALKSGFGVGLSKQGYASPAKSTWVAWSGLDQWLMGGCDVSKLARDLASTAAVTDQTDGWIGIHLAGAKAEDVMARICPLDVRASVFAKDQAARTEVDHMMALVIRRHDGFEIFFMRSFAGSAWEAVTGAARQVSALSWHS